MDPNRYKHPSILLADVRSALEPSLEAAGYVFDHRNKPHKPIYLHIDYRRGEEVFRISWDRRNSDDFIGVVAEVFSTPDQGVTVARMDFASVAERRKDELQAEIRSRMQSFVDEVNTYLAKTAQKRDAGA
jgi:hypothetical protein